MNNSENNAATFHTSNQFAEHFNQFGNTRLFDRLQKKFTPKPYYYQYRTLRGVVLVASALFHVLSAATAAALVFLFIGNLIPSPIASGGITAAVLVALEISKRETSGRFFHDLLQFSKFSPGLLAAVVGLSAASIACSYFGAEKAVRALTPPPALIVADTLTAPVKTQIAGIDEQIKGAQRNTWKGKLTAPAQRTIERLTRQKENLTNELIRQQTRVDSKNDTTEKEHAQTTETNANGFAAFTLCSEILLILCLWYLQYYDYRSFAEYCKKTSSSTDDDATNVSNINSATGNKPINGVPIYTNVVQERRPIGFHRPDENRQTKIVTAGNLRNCEHCGTGYEYRHSKQKYCCDDCRISAWQNKTGKEIKRRNVSKM